MAIADAVAEAEDVDATELPSLYEAINTDALNRLFDGRGGVKTDAILRFRVDDWHVFINADGRIRVCDTTRPTEPTPVFAGSAN